MSSACEAFDSRDGADLPRVAGGPSLASVTPDAGHNRARAWLDGVRTRLWPVPVAGIAVAVVSGVLLPEIDRWLQSTGRWSSTTYLFGGGADAARTVLSAVSGSLVTMTSLTFSLTVVTLQLASSQYSPRLLRTFTRDAVVQGTLALFLATFSYALTVLRVVRSDVGSSAAEFVPRLSVTVAFALAVASVVALVLFLAHLTREIRVETVLARVHQEAADVIRRVFPPTTEPVASPVPEAPAGRVFQLPAPTSGFVTAIDHAELLDVAADLRLVVHIDVPVGDFVVAGLPVGRAWQVGNATTDRPGSPPDRRSLGRLTATLTVGRERTSVQDVAFGLRQITDIVSRALSPGVNDPTTAAHGLGWASVLLVDLAGRRCGPDVLVDDDSGITVVVARPSFAALVDVALDQPLLYGRDDPQVMGRLIGVLHDLARAVGGPAGRITVRAHLCQVRAAVDAGGLPERERRRLGEACDRVGAVLDAG